MSMRQVGKYLILVLIVFVESAVPGPPTELLLSYGNCWISPSCGKGYGRGVRVSILWSISRSGSMQNDKKKVAGVDVTIV
uniref:Uncharacterized protein n=1 Tax=Utricularia reniformis TaxID=192314 RepID=A0A1Y0B064_9LAMI|nr:hypothetical protein AEK19_MT0505 [Utricularia reniformis]ART30761.1 hypothetical protein AEK19_MT0505 [Utricularia reniformis]